MLSISKAKEKDYQSIVDIGSVSVPEAHEGSCAPEDLKEYTTINYNETAIKKELRDANNIYHILKYEGKAVKSGCYGCLQKREKEILILKNISFGNKIINQ